MNYLKTILEKGFTPTVSWISSLARKPVAVSIDVKIDGFPDYHITGTGVTVEDACEDLYIRFKMYGTRVCKQMEQQLKNNITFFDINEDDLKAETKTACRNV